MLTFQLVGLAGFTLFFAALLSGRGGNRLAR
jgi:hypothetical protein